MKNLMTRKFLLGILMTLVLAFSVQGVAEAVNKPSNKQSVTDRIKPRLIFSTFSLPGISLALDDLANTTEAVTVTLSSGITPTGTLESHFSATTLTLTEEGGVAPDLTANPPVTGSNGRLRVGGLADNPAFSSITVMGYFNTVGEQTVTVAGTDATDGAWSVEYVYYVVNPTALAPAPGGDPVVDLTGVGYPGDTTVNYGNQDFQIVTGTTTVNELYQVKYTVSGGGRLYVKHDPTGDIEEFESSRSPSLTTSTGVNIYLDPNGTLSDGSLGYTNTVTATIVDARRSTVQTYINGTPTLEVDAPTGTEKGSRDNPGNRGEMIFNAFTATLRDQQGRVIPGAAVTFTRAATATDGELVFGSGNLGTLVTVGNALIFDGSEQVKAAETNTTNLNLYVRTNTSGKASVNLRLGSSSTQTITVAATGIAEAVVPPITVNAYSGVKPGTELSVLRIESNPDDPSAFDLYVLVEVDGKPPVSGTDVPVIFDTDDGLLKNTETNATYGPSTTEAATNANRGVAKVTFKPAVGSVSPQVTARIQKVVDSVVKTTHTITIDVRGGSDDRPPRTTNPRLSLSTVSSANPGDLVTVTATLLNQNGTQDFLSGIPVTFTASNGSFSPQTPNTNNGIARSSITIPSGVSTVTVTVTTTANYVSAQQSISVITPQADEDEDEDEDEEEAGSGIPNEIIIDGDDDITGERNRREELVVQVVDRNGEGVAGERVRFRVTEGRGNVSPASTFTDSGGYADVGFTPLSDGFIEVEVTSDDLTPVYFTITTGEPPDAIVVVSGNNQSGRPGAALANPFVVEVIDTNDDPVSGVTVNFAVTAGGGSVSPASATTNNNGRAQTTLTLGSEPGENTVAARVTGLTAVNFKATSGAEVLVKAAQRAPLYWVGKAKGTLHSLVDAEIENIAPNVQGVTSIAVDSANGLLYFAVQTGANKGTIRRIGLNGRGAQTLKKLTAAPMGIAVDSAGGTVYWTNSRGRIQSIATEGSTKIANILQNLNNPGAIAISNGQLYWGESAGRVRRMSLTAPQATPQNIATGLGEPLGIAIGKGKVYWVERSAGGAGSLQRANLNGTNIEELRTFASNAPTSLAVDSSDNRIYWTKRSGKIQRANLVGKFVKDIATGLMNPGSIALGGTVTEEEPVVEQVTQRRQTTQQTTETADTSKYDVNGDGAVDNLDVTIVALALGTTNPDYDVNGDGSVDANDLREVIANTDSNAAAPAINVDLKGLDIDFNHVQEQIEMLLASGDLSIEGQRVLRYLQHLLASARPAETVLLANYPNPFNPETWIPYHLATSTDVQVNIYNAQGVLVRALTLGHQTAGYYTSRSRAAYWDGRNAIGERVASGIYFYQLQTDEVSPMRKMVILK